MDLRFVLGVLGGIITAFSVIPYVRDIMKKTTRPNSVSWSIWVLLLTISIFAQWSAGASWSIILLIGDLIGTSTIAALSFAGYGYGKYGRLEWTCLGLAILAIISWQITSQPIWAIVFAIIADALAAFPTLVKAFRDPRSEHPTMWLLISLGALLGIASTTIVNAANLLFPFYLFVINSTIGITTLVGRKK